uniref:NF-kappa-B-activating protein C-terminal domain-containing protein n=1 Tax=Setaria viridis TaxID=4556 RepID=A0A4V6D5J6_SETVI|nr:hypothetical protein SEVIR_6G186500v2 [Setaria viridis]
MLRHSSAATLPAGPPTCFTGFISSGSELYGRDRRHRRCQKRGGRSRSRGRRRHRRRSHDTETSSESDSDGDSETYESDGSRDRKRRRSKGHKSSKRSRKSPSRKTRRGGSRRKRRKRSDSEDSGTPDRATAYAKSSNVAKEEAIRIRYRETAEARSPPALGDEAPAPLVIKPIPLPHVDTAQARYGGALRPGEGDAITRFVQQGKRVPRRGEEGLSADEIERFEVLEKVGWSKG